MNALNMAKTAYSNMTPATKTDRGIEHDAFAKITYKLKSLDPKKEFAAFGQALHENRSLWLLLAVDVADAGNGLPQSLRAQIFYLAQFTDHHTSKILAGEADVSALIDINTAIMSGLRTQMVQK